MTTVLLCNSGGSTSAYMTERVLLLQKEGKFPGYTFHIVFANTGREHPKTLAFVHKCDQRWRVKYNAHVVWVEAVVIDGYKPSEHRRVSFENASRFGGPFEDVVAKYGIPNKDFLHCTRELKENPIMHYMESVGQMKGHIFEKQHVPATYETWIGIRKDEPRRLKGNRNGKQLKVYPLADPIWTPSGMVDMACDKLDVLDFWEEMPYELGLPAYLGNCVDCHKKNIKKLEKVYQEAGEHIFRFPQYLDSKYSEVRAQVIEGKIIPRKRYRGLLDTSQLIASFKLNDFNSKRDDLEEEGCTESCDPFMDENVATTTR